MSTSGVTISQLTRDQIITLALRKLSVLGEGQDPTPAQIADAAESLGPLIQVYQTLGMFLWKRVDLPISMVPGIGSYLIGLGKDINVPYPMKLQQAYLQPANSNSQIDVHILAAYDFHLLPLNSSGTVVNIMYQPYVNYGELRVWPIPDSPLQTLHLVYQAPFEVFTNDGETPDFPQEWQMALIYGLAATLADDYALPLQDRQSLEKKAETFLSAASAFGTEDASINIIPSNKGR